MARQRRERGEGAIFYSETRRRWVGQLDAGTDAAGSRVRPIVIGRTRDEARARLAELRDARDKGIDLRARHATFAQIADLWLARDVHGHVSDETLSNYTSLLHGRIFAAIGDIPVTQLRAVDVETMLLTLQEAGRSGRYMRLARNLTQRALDYAVRRDIIDRNVATAVRTPSGPSAERYGLTVKQARRLLKVAADDRLANLVTVSLLLGLRPGEAAGLTWDNVKLKGKRPTLTVAASLRRTPLGALVLVQPKTPTSRRTLEIPPPVLAALKAQRVLQKADHAAAGRTWRNALGLVFTTEVGTPLDPSNVRRTFTRLADTAGLDPAPAHAAPRGRQPPLSRRRAARGHLRHARPPIRRSHSRDLPTPHLTSEIRTHGRDEPTRAKDVGYVAAVPGARTSVMRDRVRRAPRLSA